jgi:hypothetical protein
MARAGKGQRPSWHLDYIEVHEVQSGHAWYFKCWEWLSKSKGDGSIQRVLKVGVSELESM